MKHEEILSKYVKVRKYASGATHKSITVINAEKAVKEALSSARGVLEAILKDGHGCRFCDSGKLRTPNNPAKDHDDDCGYKMASEYLKQLNHG